MPDSTLCLLYSPCADEAEARRIATMLLQERLVACANILPSSQSLYWWEGAITSSQEVILLVKTPAPLAPEAARRIESLHSYDCPAVITLEGHANLPFAEWAHSMTHFPAKN